MKRIFLLQCELILILTACGGKAKQVAGGVSTDFFGNAISGEITVSAYDSTV
jgi:hypothetical protein